MDTEALGGEDRDFTGKVKETAGDVTSDKSLQREGLADQLTGKIQKVTDAARETLSGDGEPLTDKARRFARERPFAAAAVVGVFGLALLNTLRGKR